MAETKVKKSFFQRNAEKEIAKEEEEEKKVAMGTVRFVAIVVFSLIFLGMELYNTMVRPLDWHISYSSHLSLSLILIYLYKPFAEKFKNKWLWILDIAAIAIAIYVALYFIKDCSFFQQRVMMVDPMRPSDIFASCGLLIILVLCVWRTMGMALAGFVLFFIAYAFFGQYLPASCPFRFSGMKWQRFFEMLTLSSDGIYGSPLAACVTTIFYYFVFGALFSQCGGGQVLIDCGMKLSDKTAGGPAKASVVSSGLMGMVSGSAVANVTTTGVFTIPLMKKAGYTPEQAAAVESVASTGGQIMPPIMGVGAFIMAEMIGVSYAKIAVDALLPALGYYVAVFLLVHNIAKKNHLGGKGSETHYTSVPVVPRLYRLIPVIVLVVMIFAGMPLPTSALVGSALAIIICYVSKETRLAPKELLQAILTGVKQAANIAIPTAACGVMIGIVVRSGAANKLTTIINEVGNSHLLPALVITMIGCLILGMALPTVAAYLIANILFATTLTNLVGGIYPDMSSSTVLLMVNMFIFYFGVVAQITPPVCVASFTAAGIANGSSWKTGWTAFFFAIVAFIVPYAFIYQPAILLQANSVVEIIYACVMLFIAVFFLAGGVSGYFFATIKSPVLRAALFVAGVCVAMPGTVTDILGYGVGGVILVLQLMLARKEKAVQAA
ncbi:MAG: TRAP transporter fused permease subunit [Treponema sp.]|nr:TRAP transporter fused permease subunit [Treponema sp.]